MIVRHVPVEHVHQLWHIVAPWMASGAVHSCGEVSLDHVQMYLSQGQWALFIIEDDDALVGAAAVQFFNRPSGRVAFVTALGGEHVVSDDVIHQLGALCAQFGATQFEGAVRESVARLFMQHGFVEKYRVIEFDFSGRSPL